MKDQRFTEDPKVSGGMFLKIEDGQTVAGVLRGEVKTQYIQWVDGKSVPCEPGDMGAKFRFKVNFVEFDSKGNMTARILEQGPTVYKDLKALADDYDLSETLIKIKRTGSGKNTAYTIMPTPQKPSEKTLKALDALELHPLEEGEPTVADESDGVPF